MGLIQSNSVPIGSLNYDLFFVTSSFVTQDDDYGYVSIDDSFNFGSSSVDYLYVSACYAHVHCKHIQYILGMTIQVVQAR